MRLRISASPWAVLAGGLLFYFSDGETLLQLLLPILVHEAGHALVLRLYGCRLLELRLELSGLCMRYAGAPARSARAVCALAGPLAGLLYALAAAQLGPAGELSAGISMLFSAFNLIPAPPLDGAQIARAFLGKRTAEVLGRCCAGAVFAAGLYLLAVGKGAGLALAGAFLLLYPSSSSAMLPD